MDLSDQPVGTVLRDARERLRIDLEVLARSLRLPVRVLRALEEGDYGTLPADVYVRGFLKQYAEALGLDPVPLLRQFSTERARYPAPRVTFPWVSRSTSRAHGLWEVVTPRSLALASGLLALIVVLLYVVFQVRTYARPPRLEILEPARDQNLRDPSLTVRGRTDPTAGVFLNGERIVVRDDGSFEDVVQLGEGVNTLRFVARSIGGREHLVTREVLVPGAHPLVPPQAAGRVGTKVGPAAPPTVGPSTTQTGPFVLSVTAEEEEVWISLAADEKVVFAGLLTAGSAYTVRGERVTVTSGKAAHTRVRIDGQDRGVLDTAPGVVRDILFTRVSSTGTIERQEKPPPTPS